MEAHSLELSGPSSCCFSSSFQLAELYTGGCREGPAVSEPPELDISDYMKLDEYSSCLTVAAGEFENPAFLARSDGGPDEHAAKCEEVKRRKVEGGCRIGFRTRSDVEILDDGFKWRKYGRKSVKNSPNPRNYYRCSSQGCEVKKRVERDGTDPSYVITAYDGKHNHESPHSRQYPTLLHQAENNSSAWGSCGHMMPAMAPNHSWNEQFAPFSYT